VSAYTDAFTDLYQAQTEATGVTVLATVGSVATSKAAILSEADSLREYIDGSTSEAGGFTLEMLISDFSARPTVGTQVTCNGSATGFTLQVIDVKTINSATYLITVGDVNNG
jgi:hypothetical protein